MTKKIWVRVSSDNYGPMERCIACGVEQPDSATAFRQLHYDDCSSAPSPTDFLERIEELNHVKKEPDLHSESKRVGALQKAVRQSAEKKEASVRAELVRKIRTGEVIATTNMSDPHRKVKEQIGFLDSAIKGKNLEFLRIQIQWSQALILSDASSTDNDLIQRLKSQIDAAVALIKKLSIGP